MLTEDGGVGEKERGNRMVKRPLTESIVSGEGENILQTLWKVIEPRQKRLGESDYQVYEHAPQCE